MDRTSSNLKRVVHSILIKHPTLLDFIREERYRIADTKLTYRQITRLDQSNLLQERRTSDKQWRNFNLNDLLYLHVITQAKLFNSSHDKLKQLKAMFYGEGLNLSKVGEISYSEIALVALLTETIPVGLLIFSDGEVSLADDDSIAFTAGYGDFKHRAFMFIMLYQTFKPQLASINQDPKFTQFDLKEFENDYSAVPLTRQQRLLLNIVEDGEYSEVTISKRQTGELIVKASKTLNTPALTRADILKICDEQDFGDVKITRQGNKDISYRIEDTFKI